VLQHDWSDMQIINTNDSVYSKKSFCMVIFQKIAPNTPNTIQWIIKASILCDKSELLTIFYQHLLNNLEHYAYSIIHEACRYLLNII